MISQDEPAIHFYLFQNFIFNSQLFSSIDPLNLQKRLERGDDLFILDVREPIELESPLGKIKGVENIPIAKLITNINALEQYKNQEIILVCRSGGRASTAA